MSIRDVLSKNIRAIRTDRGMTQEQLASKSGLTHTYVNRLEAGAVNVSVDNLDKIATALHVPFEALITGLKNVPASSVKVRAMMADMRRAIELLEKNLTETESNGRKPSASKKTKKK